MIKKVTNIQEFINGELLGDMCISSRSKISGRIIYASKHKTYIEWISDILNGFGIKQAGNIIKYTHKKNKGTYYTYTSISMPMLKKLHNKWYYGNRKVIPKDLKLTPVIDEINLRYDGAEELIKILNNFKDNLKEDANISSMEKGIQNKGLVKEWQIDGKKIKFEVIKK